MPSALLPPNATALERMLADTPELDRLTPEVIATLWDASTCPVANLPWLAWALSVDDWDESWPEATQRAVISGSIALHKKKGTPWAIKEAVAQTGYRALMTEWWQMTPRGTPHTFAVDVEVSDRGIDIPTQTAIERRIDAVKPARSHYTLRVLGVSRASVRHAVVTLSGEVTEVFPYSVTTITAQPSAGPRIGIGQQSWMTTEIRPQ